MTDFRIDEAWQPISVQEREQRISNFRALLNERNLDAVILTPGSNMRYFLGLTWSETERFVGAVITQTDIIYICPKFEDTALLSGISIEGTDYKFWEEHENPSLICETLLASLNVKRMSLDPNCTYRHSVALINNANVKMTLAGGLIEILRREKTDAEIALMQVAKRITNRVHRDIFSWIEPGMKASTVRQEIDTLHRRYGADSGNSFCAVQFGEATSHPHGVPGDQTLSDGDIILIDTGCRIDGYNSDITRTYALNKVSPEIERIWALEKAAQCAVFEHARPGVTGESLDVFVREFLHENGLGKDYDLPGLPHRLGHGIGLDIHEGPYLVRGDTTLLAKGMCFSNEPMIVVPNRFGVRLEDHFWVSETSAEWFTEPQHSLYKPYL